VPRYTIQYNHYTIVPLTQGGSLKKSEREKKVKSMRKRKKIYVSHIHGNDSIFC